MGRPAREGRYLFLIYSTMLSQFGCAFFIKLLPVALQAAIEEDLDFRRSLPIDYLQYMGVANYDFDTSQMVRAVVGEEGSRKFIFLFLHATIVHIASTPSPPLPSQTLHWPHITLNIASY